MELPLERKSAFLRNSELFRNMPLPALEQLATEATCRTYPPGSLLEGYDPATAGCVLLDLRMRGMSGIAAQRKLRAIGATAPIVMITGFASVSIAVEAMKAGAFDLLEKPVPMQELLEVVQSALRADTRRRHDLSRIRSYRSRFALLIEREREIALRMIDGDASKVIESTARPITNGSKRAGGWSRMPDVGTGQARRSVLDADHTYRDPRVRMAAPAMR